MDLYLCDNITQREDAYALLARAVHRSVQTPEARILHDAMERIMAITCPMEKRE